MDPSSDDSGNPPSVAKRLLDFLEQNRPKMLAHAERILGRQDPSISAEDVVQSAALSFYHYLRDRPDADLGDGLIALARRCIETAANDFRKSWRPRQPAGPGQRIVAMPASSLMPGDPQPGPRTDAIVGERRDRRHVALRAAIDKLEPLDRRILQMRVDDERHFTFARLAGLLGMTEAAVRMRYNRAIDRMKPVLKALLAGDSELSPD